MYIARILYPVEVLGPGKRIGIWFDGCPRRCKGCSNPELWEFSEKYNIPIDRIKQLINEIVKSNKIDGFTLTGGDPFFQYNDLKELLNYISSINDDVLVYTGYTFSELSDKDLTNIAVLIDGPYIEAKNDGCVLRGSNNQQIYILSEKHKEKYKEYLESSKNQIQNFTTSDGIISVGIHKREFSF